jgi:hypothetical protein
MKNTHLDFFGIKTYKKDGRRSLLELWNKYLELEESGWEKELIAEQKLILDGKEITFPVYAFKTLLTNGKPVKAMWVLGGVHGEEPAGPNAFFEQLDTIKKMGMSGVPMVFIPLLNPSGYSRDFRYEDEYRDFRKGHSVTDSEHYLIQEGLEKPRVETPNSKTAGDVTSWVEKTVSLYQPELVIDHHEDRVPEKFPEGDLRNLTSCYVYISGNGSKTEEIAKKINTIFKETNLPVVNKGITRFGEEIVDGMVMNYADGSIDEFLTVSKYYDPETHKLKSKHPAATVIVVETTIPFDGSISVEQRVEAHGKIVKSYPEFWAMVDSEV